MKFLKWPLRLSFHETNLDLEDSSPLGGPTSDPSSGFFHTYTPTNTYLNSELASKVKGTSKNENSFKTTGLDLIELIQVYQWVNIKIKDQVICLVLSLVMLILI